MKGEPIHFGLLSKAERKAMEELQLKHNSPPIVALHMLNVMFTDATDACDRQDGPV